MKTYTIYKLIAPNGKIYVGQTCNVNNRFSQYKSLSCKAQKLLYHSLIYYGWDSFIKEIVDVGLTKEEANILEIKLIAENKALKTSLNILIGGESTRPWKPIVQFTLDGVVLKEWDSIEQASDKLKLRPQGIRRACGDKYNRYMGFCWLYKEDFELGKKPIHPNTTMNMPILQLSIEGELIKEFPLMKAAVEELDISYSSISQCISGLKETAGGFVFKRK